MKLKESVFDVFAEKHMKTKEIYTERGELNLFVIRAHDQEFYILSYSDPMVINNMAKSE